MQITITFVTYIVFRDLCLIYNRKEGGELFQFLTAATYKIFGEHDQIGRVWAFLFSLGALFFFFKLAREYLSPFPAIIAFAFFALNPLAVEQSTAIQPEGLTLLGYIAAVYF